MTWVIVALIVVSLGALIIWGARKASEADEDLADFDGQGEQKLGIFRVLKGNRRR